MSSYVAPSAPVMGTVLGSQNVSEAKGFAKERATEIRKDVSEGNWSLRIFALLGALAMIVISVLGFLGHVVSLRWISAIYDIYTFIMGFVIIILEEGHRLSFFKKPQSTIFKNAAFLKTVYGRGFLYFFSGTLLLAQYNMVAWIIGACICLIGIVYVLAGRSASKKMGELRRSAVTPEMLQEKFAIADVDGKGSLTVDQFRTLTSDLGMDLTRREVESVFMQLDCEQSGRVRYETVLSWWNNEATEQDDFQVTTV